MRLLLVAMMVVGVPSLGHATTAAAAEPSGPAPARLVRTTWTNELGVPRPTGLAYVPTRNEFVVAGAPSSTTPLVRVGRDETARGSLELPALADPSTLSFDPATNELSAVSGNQLVVAPGSGLTNRRPGTTRADISGLGLRQAKGATYDPATGNWFVLDAGAPAIVRIGARGSHPSAPARTALSSLAGKTLRGLAFNPTDGLLYTTDGHLLYGVDGKGNVAKTYDMGDTGVRNPVAMTFAPSTDNTDAPANQNLFIADAGDTSMLGGVAEATLAPQAALAAPVDSGTLVRTIDTSAFSPASPDPSGLAYIPSTDRLELCDSEVDEVTGAGYHGVNLWQMTRTGTVTDTGTTFPAFSKEPTGLGYIVASNTLLISDDSARAIHLVKAGADGRFGTSDDVVTDIDTLALGSDDTEDPAFDPVSGDIFFVDGVSTEVYRVSPGANGVFGDSDDTATHFDIGQFGITDSEALAYYAPNDDLIVGNRTGRQLLEVTKTGTLVRTIDLTGVPGLSLVSGVTVAPSSTGSGQLNFWIADRKVDNGPNPNENDGKVYEVSAGPTNNTAPVVDTVAIAQTAPTTNTTLSVNVTAHDADNDPLTYLYQWRKNGVSIPNATGATLDLSLAGNGDKGDQISVRVNAFDGIIQSAPKTSSQVAVVNSPPAFNQNLANRTDAEGATVSFSAGATDPDSDPLTYGASGLPPGVSINTATGAISGQIMTGAATGSPYAASVTVREGATVDATDTFTWSVTAGTPPVITPGAVSTAEGNSGTHIANVPVTLDRASAATVTVQYQTIEPSGLANGAKAPGDYATTSGTVTFSPGQTSKTVPVVVNGDNTREADELVIVSFTNATNATIGGYLGLGVVTITNDDPLPVVTPGTVSTAEGNSGTHVANVPVTLDRASSSTVTVHYQTIEPAGLANGAKAPGDYVVTSGTLTFAPGQTSKTVPVTIRGDTVREANELVTVSFTNPSGATVGGFYGLGVITITNDD
jgi:hypothetical protein